MSDQGTTSAASNTPTPTPTPKKKRKTPSTCPRAKRIKPETEETVSLFAHQVAAVKKMFDIVRLRYSFIESRFITHDAEDPFECCGDDFERFTFGHLALKMGSGKTCITLSFIRELLEQNPAAKFLILIPYSLCFQWRAECIKVLGEQFLQDRVAYMSGIKDIKNSRFKLPEELDECLRAHFHNKNVWILNRNLLHTFKFTATMRVLVSSHRFDTVFLDEINKEYSIIDRKFMWLISAEKEEDMTYCSGASIGDPKYGLSKFATRRFAPKSTVASTRSWTSSPARIR